MDFTIPTTKEGWQKWIFGVLAILLSVATAFGLTAAQADTITTIVGTLSPIVLNIIFSFFNQSAAKGKAAQVIAVMEAQTNNAVAVTNALSAAGADVAPIVIAIAEATTGTVTGSVISIADAFIEVPAYTAGKARDWSKTKADILKAIDLANNGNHADLTSENPSLVWNKTQAVVIGYKCVDLNDATEITEELLLPTALAALEDQKAQLTGKQCDWPPSPYAGAWVKWCYAHIDALKKASQSVYKDKLNGFSAWDAGEIAVSWINFSVAVIENSSGTGGKVIKTWFDGKTSEGIDSVHSMAV